MEKGTFVPAFHKIVFLKKSRNCVLKCKKEVSNIEVTGSLDFDLIKKFRNYRTNYLLNCDKSCDEISRFRKFEKKAFAGRSETQLYLDRIKSVL